MKNSFMKDQNNHIHRSHLIHRVTRINQIPRFNTFTRLKRITLIIRIKFIRIARFIHFTRTNPSQPQILPSGSLYLFLKNPPEIMTVSFKFSCQIMLVGPNFFKPAYCYFSFSAKSASRSKQSFSTWIQQKIGQVHNQIVNYRHL